MICPPEGQKGWLWGKMAGVVLNNLVQEKEKQGRA
jgi:hypothetical protein